MHTLPEIQAGLSTARQTVGEYFGGLPAADLYRRVPGEWAPIDDLRHLVRSVLPLARALALPKLVLRLRFGRARRASSSYDELKRRYSEGLRAGFRATPDFVPPPVEPEDPEAFRRGKLAAWAAACDRLERALERWDERTLDRYVLPHPGLGSLTIREMLFFTHFHDLHHVEVARGRMRKAIAAELGLG